MINTLLELVVGKRHTDSGTRLDNAFNANAAAADTAHAEVSETRAAAQEARESSSEVCSCLECQGHQSCAEKSELNPGIVPAV